MHMSLPVWTLIMNDFFAAVPPVHSLSQIASFISSLLDFCFRTHRKSAWSQYVFFLDSTIWKPNVFKWHLKSIVFNMKWKGSNVQNRQAKANYKGFLQNQVSGRVLAWSTWGILILGFIHFFCKVLLIHQDLMQIFTTLYHSMNLQTGLECLD